MPNIYTVEHRVVEVEGIDDLTLKYRSIWGAVRDKLSWQILLANFNFCKIRQCIVYYILIDWVWGNSKFVVPETLTIGRGEGEVNSQGRGDNKLAIPEYTVYKYFIIPKNIRFIVEWSPQNDKDQ